MADEDQHELDVLQRALGVVTDARGRLRGAIEELDQLGIGFHGDNALTLVGYARVVAEDLHDLAGKIEQAIHLRT